MTSVFANFGDDVDVDVDVEDDDDDDDVISISFSSAVLAYRCNDDGTDTTLTSLFTSCSLTFAVSVSRRVASYTERATTDVDDDDDDDDDGEC
jgi:hypothetical protein